MKKILLLVIVFPFFALAQNHISGTLSPKGKFKQAFLYQVTPKYPAYISYKNVSDEGRVEIPLEENLSSGMYRLVFGIPQDEYYFDFIYNGSEDITFEYKMGEGVTFLTSEENIMLQEYNQRADEAKAMLQEVFKPDVSKETFFTVFKAIEAVQDTYEKQSEGLIAHQFIKTGRIPMPEKQLSAKEYLALEKHNFFNHIDFSNSVLQHSDYLINAATIYVYRFADKNDNNAYKQNIDFIATEIGENAVLKKTIFESLWEDFSSEENTEVANYIADSYLLKLAEAYGDQKLIAKINSFQKTGMGAKAPNFNLGNGKSLHELSDANHYLLIFWSSTCSHCLKEIPEVKLFLEKQNMDASKLQVVAFGLEDDANPWKDNIKEYPEFIHVFGSGKWDNQTAVEYSIVATPTYFLLNGDKKIIAKPETLEALKNEIEKL
ncbi:TlpA family protein disulfide reductase [Galbibacter mesophilus]|uniref:TlpA family protein disulfide reductase n=1 Tax=Galbibacter mesophilus TaxID=379069 RepID=UPI00191DD1C8|nr:thioredoxin-like domain-containing protein [Galbibacter mesophilus]MCM5662010.1 redoxin domain-containing protein [Galbibacter mesophilus]